MHRTFQSSYISGVKVSDIQNDYIQRSKRLWYFFLNRFRLSSSMELPLKNFPDKIGQLKLFQEKSFRYDET